MNIKCTKAIEKTQTYVSLKVENETFCFYFCDRMESWKGICQTVNKQQHKRIRM